MPTVMSVASKPCTSLPKSMEIGIGLALVGLTAVEVITPTGAVGSKMMESGPLHAVLVFVRVSAHAPAGMSIVIVASVVPLGVMWLVKTLGPPLMAPAVALVTVMSVAGSLNPVASSLKVMVRSKAAFTATGAVSTGTGPRVSMTVYAAWATALSVLPERTPMALMVSGVPTTAKVWMGNAVVNTWDDVLGVLPSRV